jgi:ABC-2 type transport system ATP-binding protein
MDKLNSNTPALSIKNLKKVYPRGVMALNGIDLEVKQGDFFALLGPNGAGKSTTIGIISSLVTKTSGEVFIMGQETETPSGQSKAKTYLGLVPQEFNFGIFEKVINIVSLSAGYYGIPEKEAKEKAAHYLNKLHLWDKRDEQARNLSGGMKRRLMIARALVHEPKLLILDEPTAGVDIEIRRTMWEYLQELNSQGITIILTTHYLEEAECLCKNVAIINSGRIIEKSSMRGLLEKLQVETFVMDLVKKPDFHINEETRKAALKKGIDFRFIDDETLEVDLKQEATFNDVFHYIDQSALTVRSLKNKTNRLEELFVRLTKND